MVAKNGNNIATTSQTKHAATTMQQRKNHNSILRRCGLKYSMLLLVVAAILYDRQTIDQDLRQSVSGDTRNQRDVSTLRQLSEENETSSRRGITVNTEPRRTKINEKADNTLTSTPAKPPQSLDQPQPLATARSRRDSGYTSPACTLQADNGQHFSRIVFLHMRKAGGTSVRKYLREATERLQMPLRIMEADLGVEQPGDDPDALYVTHVRDPVQRTISHYKYEQRWDCPSQLMKEGFVPALDNQKSTLAEFAGTDFAVGQATFWLCSSECYTRWATGLFDHAMNQTVLAQKGRETLFNYHLVIVSEWLKDPEYARSLESVFGQPDIDRKVGMHCGDEAAAANEQVPLEITKETLDLIESRNAIDRALYQDLTTCPNGKTRFGGRHVVLEPTPEGRKQWRKEQEKFLERKRKSAERRGKPKQAAYYRAKFWELRRSQASNGAPAMKLKQIV